MPPSGAQCASAGHLVPDYVETLDQAGLLMEYGCDTAQNYPFSRPLPEADLTA